MDMTITLGNAITLLGILLGASVGWGVAKQRLDDHERRIKAHTDQLSQENECMVEIKVELAKIARDILYIRERLDKEGR
jgi:hypothetical protein